MNKKETMTAKERWLAILHRQKPDRIPLDYRATEEATKKVMKYLKCKDLNDLFMRFHIDKAISIKPKYVGPGILDNMDIFGCRFRNAEYKGGTYQECIYHPLAKYKTLKQIKNNYKWPKPDWYNYSEIPKQIIGKEMYSIFGGGSEPFLTYRDLRSTEQAFLDLILHPEIVHFCLDKLFNLCYENTLRIYEQIPGKVTITVVAEDMGSQENLLYSPNQIRKFLIPRMKRMIDLAHEAGAFVFFHSDGAIRKIIPDMIKAGVDILDPIQWRCKGMDRERLKQDFGDKLVFHGGVDNQYTLAFGSVEEVRQEVIDNIHILGKNGGYILGPCHNIQVVSPPENIVAMYETAYEEGWN